MMNKPADSHQVIAHPLNISQIDEIAQLLALAFRNGSGLSKICNAQGEELLRRLRLVIHSGLALQAAANQQVLSVTQEAQITGVAVIEQPESRFPLWAQISWLLQVSVGVSPSVAWRLWYSLRVLKQYHPPEPHYYLVLLGVHPNFQGKGYARALLDALHARSEAHPRSTGVYLETANPQNVEFYRAFGYQLKTQVNIKAVENFIMFRPNLLKSNNSSQRLNN